jgi:hypothetical protein
MRKEWPPLIVLYLLTRRLIEESRDLNERSKEMKETNSRKKNRKEKDP